MKKALRYIILIILIVALCVSGYKLVTTYGKLHEEKKEIEEIREEEKLPFDENEDMIGWLSIEGTPVDYPVMFTPDDPEHYLHRDFGGEYSYSGLPFLDARCDIISSENLMIYGHNMKNSTMFSTLLKYRDYSYYEAHPVISFETETEKREYQIIAAYESEVKAKDDTSFKYYDFFNGDKDSYENYIQGVKGLAFYDTEIKAEYDTQLMTLSTCSYHVEDGRFAVTAVRIR